MLQQAASCTNEKGWATDGTGSPHPELTWHGDRSWLPSSGRLLETERYLEDLCEPVSIAQCNPDPAKPDLL